MRTPARILRNTVTRTDPLWERLTDKQRWQRERIMDLGQALMAIHGRHTMTMASFAAAIGHGPALVRRFFPDLDSLLAHILHRHLLLVCRALGEAARSRPDDQPALRDAYAEATRAGFGSLSEAHLLLTRDRHLLPEDELEHLERSRTTIGQTMAGELGRQAMLLLDDPFLDLPTIELMLSAAHRSAPAEACPEAPAEPALPRQRQEHPAPAESQPPPIPIQPSFHRPARTHQARAGP